MNSPGAKRGAAKQRWRLPGGAGAFPPEIVDEIQRARILEAVCIAIAEEGGYGKMAVTDILARAGMSNKTFYDYFDNKEDCVLAAYDAYGARLAAALGVAFAAVEGFAERVRAAIAALLDFGAEAPGQLRFLLLDAQTAGPALNAAQRRAVGRLAAKLREGRVEGEGAAGPAPDVEEMIVAGIGWRVGRALLDGEPLEPLGPGLVEFALVPYLGVGAARRFARP